MEGRWARVGAVVGERGLVRQGVGGMLFAVINGMQVGLRFCGRDFDSVFWGACVLVVIGVVISTRSMLRLRREG